MEREEIIRRHFVCFGRVQGVGFRYRACRAAQALRITGYVCNRFDGSVELELQGTAEQMAKFWVMLTQNSYIEIEDRTMTKMEPNPREMGFTLRDYEDWT